MADIARIKGNISKMIAQDAPEADIDAYVASEGITLDDLQNKPEDSAAGLAKAAGSGVVKGITGTLGLGGDAGSLVGSGVDMLGSAVGATPDKVQQFKELMARGLRNNPLTAAPANILQGPSSQDLQSGVEKITGPLYKPQTSLEGYAQSLGEFLPAAAGGGGLLARGARIAAPALLSETAGQATQGSDLEPYARLGGALLGGAGVSGIERSFANRANKVLPPTGDELLASGSRGFDTVKASDAVINPSSVQQIAKDIRTELLNEGRHPTLGNQSGIFNTLDRLEAMGASGGGVTPKDLEVIRKNLVAEKTSIDGGTREAAKQATDAFMSKYSGMGQGDILSGSNPFPTLKNAVADWAAGKRSAAVTGKADLANLNAGTAGSGANEDNALRQAMKQLARPINNTNTPVAKRLGFNDEEIAAIKNAAMGTTAGNVARYIGKAAPTGIVSGAGSAGVGGLAGGPIGAVALPAAGYIAKKIGDLSTKQAVQAVDSLVRSRSPLAAQVAQQLPQITSQLPPKTQELLRALFLADASQQGGQSVGQQNTYQAR